MIEVRLAPVSAELKPATSDLASRSDELDKAKQDAADASSEMATAPNEITAVEAAVVDLISETGRRVPRRRSRHAAPSLVSSTARVSPIPEASYSTTSPTTRPGANSNRAAGIGRLRPLPSTS